MDESEYTVRFIGGDLQHQDEMWLVLNPIAQSLKVNLSVSNPHGSTCPFDHQDNTIFIRFWSTPTITDDKKYFKAFGIDLFGGQKDGREPTGIGIPIMDEDGTIVAESMGDNLYILFDLPHGETPSLILSEIMSRFVKLHSDDIEERKKAVEEIDRKVELFSRNFFTDLEAGQLSRRIEESNRKIAKLDTDMLNYQEAIIKTSRVRQEENRINAFLKDRQNNPNREKGKSMYDELIKLSSTGSIRVLGNTVSVPVGQIDVEYGGVTYDIGEFTIIIYVDGDNGGVRCINNTRTVGRYYHPHVLSDGDCCLGNISLGIAKLIGEVEFPVVICMMIEYLKTVNSKDWYFNVDNWPIKSGPVVLSEENTDAPVNDESGEPVEETIASDDEPF